MSGLIVTLFAFGSVVLAQDAAVRQAAEALDAALLNRDRAALESMIADGFEFVHSTGRLEDRASFINRAAAGQLAVQANPGRKVEDKLQVFDATAIRTTLTEVVTPAAATPARIYTRYVYVRQEGRWRMVSAQSTVVVRAQ